jgi:hypothetical protein
LRRLLKKRPNSLISPSSHEEVKCVSGCRIETGLRVVVCEIGLKIYWFRTSIIDENNFPVNSIFNTTKQNELHCPSSLTGITNDRDGLSAAAAVTI